jgi:hypothetical protein
VGGSTDRPDVWIAGAVCTTRPRRAAAGVRRPRQVSHRPPSRCARGGGPARGPRAGRGPDHAPGRGPGRRGSRTTSGRHRRRPRPGSSTAGRRPAPTRFLYSIEETDEFGNQVGIEGRWHSAAFTWDGEVLALGWEPGGGAAGECEADDPDIKKSLFFYDAQTGEKLGQWTLPRPQEEVENCTIHNYNIVPMRDGSYIVVMGNYQAGTWVVDFSDPANPETMAWSDPLPLDPEDLGGAWSSYWYNGRIYESSITEGLNVFRVSDKALAKSIRLDHLNPQTQEFSLP